MAFDHPGSELYNLLREETLPRNESADNNLTGNERRYRAGTISGLKRRRRPAAELGRRREWSSRASDGADRPKEYPPIREPLGIIGGQNGTYRTNR
jgi:hypothetical protein